MLQRKVWDRTEGIDVCVSVLSSQFMIIKVLWNQNIVSSKDGTPLWYDDISYHVEV